jgi:hypothetical protein
MQAVHTSATGCWRFRSQTRNRRKFRSSWMTSMGITLATEAGAWSLMWRVLETESFFHCCRSDPNLLFRLGWVWNPLLPCSFRFLLCSLNCVIRVTCSSVVIETGLLCSDVPTGHGAVGLIGKWPAFTDAKDNLQISCVIPGTVKLYSTF